ncbi:hypothetical protein, partial [Streptococcus suis]|uniref:hypothetical protein n=1 Tax=Streptococcus suis TaxID=1307 RepID=UPI00370385A5
LYIIRAFQLLEKCKQSTYQIITLIVSIHSISLLSIQNNVISDKDCILKDLLDSVLDLVLGYSFSNGHCVET